MDLIPVHTQEKEVTKDEFDFEMQVEEMYSYDDIVHLDQDMVIFILLSSLKFKNPTNG